MDNEKVSLEYTIDEARKRNNTQALEELLEIGERYPDRESNQLTDLKAQRTWLLEFGGAFHDTAKMNGQKLYSDMAPGERALYKPEKANKGENFSMQQLWNEIINVDFYDNTEFKVPVYFLLGASDYNTPSKIAERYFNTLQAPSKALIWFNESGHYLPFEEAEKFNLTIKSIADTILQVNDAE